jgi:anti-anti-sigma regulatory factor
MWKIERTNEGELVVLLVSGRIEQKHLTELREVLIADAGSRNLILDMREVRLVDQDAITFLSYCEAEGAELRNCPPYIREWIERDREAVTGS